MSPETPRALGYRMPAEWEPHEATWLAWPHDPLTWVNGVEAAEAAFVAMIQALAPGERVEVLVHDDAMAERARRLLEDDGLDVSTSPYRAHPETGALQATDEQVAPPKRRGHIRLHRVGHQDSWVRDYGPSFLVDGHGNLGAVDWTFDAWGGKYETLEPDDRLGRFISEVAGARRFRVDRVMEGGAVDVDGQGAVLTTEQCLLHENRNPSLSRAEIETLVTDHLGAERVLWLGRGIVGDDTDGHVDDVARFVSPDTVVAACEPHLDSPNHEALAENLERLTKMATGGGRPLEVVRLPMPEPVTHDGEPVPASYANFTIGNEVVLLPVFGDPHDAEARSVLEACFPNRQVVAIPARDLIVGMGACHCLTQQQPRV